MRIQIDSTVLAQDALVADADAAPQSDLHLAEETTIQESKPINSDLRTLFNRKNAGGTLSFMVRPRYSTLEAAASAVFRLAGRRGTKGELKVWANGVYATPAPTPTASRTGAIVKKADARQIGVTVEVKYEIVF